MELIYLRMILSKGPSGETKMKPLLNSLKVGQDKKRNVMDYWSQDGSPHTGESLLSFTPPAGSIISWVTWPI